MVAALWQAAKAHEMFSDVEIAKVWFWSVLHDRPVGWACDQQSWPLHERRWAKSSESHLPPWARTYRRVHRWVQAKLILSRLRQQILSTTYVA
jgi:hypothetical protein